MGRLAELQRKLLEQLMGAEAMGIIQVDISMWDPKVCRPYMTGICPHELFTNTKMDLGSCLRTHSAKLKNQYNEELKKATEDKDDRKVAELNRMKVDYEQVIFQFVDECDRRIRAAQRRLEKTPEENNRTTALMREIGEIEGAYQAAMADVEQLGSEGKVDESMSQLTKAEALKSEKQEKERELQSLTETAGASGHQKLRVCDICGAYLSILDSDRRLADHFGGKMHLGYLQLRTLMDEWKARGPLPVAAAAPRQQTAIPSGQAGTPGSKPPVPPFNAASSAPGGGPGSFRPIPHSASGANGHHHIPTGPAFIAPTGPSGDRNGAKNGVAPPSGPAGDRSGERDRSDRDRERERERAGDKARDRERDGHRSSRHDEKDRDRPNHSSSSSRRGGSERDAASSEHRSSRHGGDDRERSDRERGSERDGHRSSRRHVADEEERMTSGRSRSSRHIDAGEEEPKRSSSRRTYEEGEEVELKDKRRRVE